MLNHKQMIFYALSCNTGGLIPDCQTNNNGLPCEWYEGKCEHPLHPDRLHEEFIEKEALC